MADAKTLGVILGAVIVVTLAVSLLGQIASSNAELTTLNPAYETPTIVRNTGNGQVNITAVVSFTHAYPSGDWRLTDSACNYQSVIVKTTNGTVATITTDYTVDTQNGSLLFKNTGVINQSLTSNTTNVTFNYCLPGYNSNTASRSVAGIILIGCALVLVASGVLWLRKTADYL